MSKFVALLTLASALLTSAPNAGSTTLYSFAASTDGWSSQADETFAVTFASAGGVDGSGGLAIAATTSRNSFQIVHAQDADWPATPNAFAAITFDALLSPGVELDFATTGVQVRDSSGNAGTVYMAGSTQDLGNGWVRIVLMPSGLNQLPSSHKDDGINLHIGTTTAIANAQIAVIDNVAAALVPEPSSAFLLLGGLSLAAVWRRIRR